MAGSPFQHSAPAECWPETIPNQTNRVMKMIGLPHASPRHAYALAETYRARGVTYDRACHTIAKRFGDKYTLSHARQIASAYGKRTHWPKRRRNLSAFCAAAEAHFPNHDYL